MLLRVMLAARRPEVEARLRRLIERDDVVLTALPPEGDIGAGLVGENCDMLLLTPARLPADVAGVVSAFAGSVPPELVLLGAIDDEQTAQLVADGVSSVLSLSLDDESLRTALDGLIERRTAALAAAQPLAEDVGPRDIHPRIAGFVTRSEVMRKFLSQAAKVTRSNTTLLIAGETGVGKEWLARAVHLESARSRGPFVAVNCGALPDSLLESELFGHEAGAFTGAQRARRGMFEMAHGGTLFLDEVGEMPAHLQVKLLRAIQSREIQRLGSEKMTAVDIRLIAASNRDLQNEVNDGRFREDLYYRLSVVTLRVPSLRERREDIPDLVRAYVDHFRTQFPNEVEGLSAVPLDALVAYDWPGNVRELMNVIERAVLLCDGDQIELADLPDEIAAAGAPSTTPSSSETEPGDVPGTWVYPRELLDMPFHEARASLLESFERSYFAHLLTLSEGRVGLTARQAGIDPRSLYDKMRKLGMDKSQFRASSD